MPPASSNTFYVTPNPEDFYCYLDSAYPFAIHFAILRSIYLNGLSIKNRQPLASCLSSCVIHFIFQTGVVPQHFEESHPKELLHHNIPVVSIGFLTILDCTQFMIQFLAPLTRLTVVVCISMVGNRIVNAADR